MKRFLFLAAEQVHQQGELPNMRFQTIRNHMGRHISFKRVESPLVAPPLVDLAWRLLLTYTPQYNYISIILGVFLERSH